ncbi:peptidoglycan/LPS O-acetylase OafA/YrhL [Novosphingobium sp. PhB165]|uniref:acyltransferase family protein n=1 Tax=Novosphingobium sp. PhB165 TaxID=2485105 RepID=UPI0010EBB14A|nr:acyltransferase [Novosphingobium sp. PhB165]TCM17995.1 peptidoglycan/LPS O-acetylase OafA/YrhL [Novosphingobium sp. PhB165]
MDRNGANDSSRNHGIDLMRAVLVLGVMAFHYTIRWAPPDFPYDILHYDAAYSRHWAIGGFGVHMFFMISGYVITLSVLRAGSAFRFAMSRFLRIYPAFLIAAIGACAIPRLFGPWQLHSTPMDLLTTLLLVPTELGAHYTDGAFWTLTVEAKFYAFVFAGYIAAKERFWVLLAALGVAGPLVFEVIPGVGDKLLISHYLGFFLIGMSAWYAMNAREPGPASALGASGIFACVMSFDTIAYDGAVSYVSLGLLALGAVAIFLLARFNPRLRLPPFGFLGGISYELYLVHQVAGLSLIARLKTLTALPDVACMVLSALAMFALATLLQRGASPPLRRAFRSGLDRVAALSAPWSFPLRRRAALPPDLS